MSNPAGKKAFQWLPAQYCAIISPTGANLMHQKKQFSLVFFILKSLFVISWVALFSYPAIWHLTTTDKVFRRYHLWQKATRIVDDKVYPFVDFLHMITYPVHNAALKGKLDRVARLSPDQDSLNGLDWFNMTPLGYATWNGESEPLLAFLDAGAAPDVALFNGNTALSLAATNRDEKSALTLLKAGARADIADNTGVTALHILIRHNMKQAFMSSLTSEVNVNAKDAKGLSLLDYAIRQNSFDFVTALAVAGAEPSYTLTPKDIKIGIFLAQWQKTGRADQAVEFVAEAAGQHKYDNSYYGLPAEFPVDLKKPTKNEQRGGNNEDL